MAEGFELVRTVRQHLRRGAALFDEGKLDEAFAEANSARALDPESLPAQALIDRIETARRVLASPEAVPAKPTSFVPHGVNAASWRGFEQRIQERRFRALLETINTSIVAGDAMAARLALEEARELRPDAPELASFEARVAAVPVGRTVAETTGSTRIWMRAMGAAALLVIGVSMLIGLESMRPSPTIAPVAPAATPAAVVIPAEDLRPTDAPPLSPAPLPLETDDESVPAIIVPPEPTLRPRGTTGTGTPSPTVAPIPAPAPNRPIAMNEPPAVIERRTLADDPPVRPVGEVADDFVAQASATRTATPPDVELARAPLPSVRVPSPAPDATAAIAESEPPPSAAVVPAAVVTPGEQSRVEEVLRRYARAYDALDASAARAVWPTVNEKALARAFQDLASQNVSFDNCDIDIRGAVANASCRGHASYVGKVGSREPRTEPRTWRFELRRDGDAWKIENAETRRLSTSTEYRER